MLRLMRDYASSWLIKVILGAIVIVFVFWGVGSFRAQKGGRVAIVNGDSITREEYKEEYNNLIEQLRQRFGNRLDDEMIQMLQIKNQALNRLIDQKLLLQEAEKLNFRVSDDELAAAIREIKAFQTSGVFDKRIYRSILNRYGLTPKQFEVNQKGFMLIEKLKSFLLGSLKVSDGEAMEWFKWSNASVNIDYILFEPGRYKDIDPSAEDIKTFFVDHKESYKTEPMIKVRFLCFAPDNYRPKVNISDKKIQDYYETHQEEFKTDKTVDEAKKGIRKKLIDEEAKTLAYEEAESVFDTIFQGDDLEKASNERNLNLQTTDFFTIKGPDKGIKNREKFASAAFNLSAMEISDIQDLGDGYYILQVIEKNPGEIPELKDVEEKVMTALIKEKQDEKASTDANEFLSGLKKGKLMNAQRAKYDLKLSSTGFFKRNEPVPDIGSEREIIEAAFKLSNKIKLPEKTIKGEKGYYVISFKERKDADPEGFAKEKANIKEKLLRQKRIKTFDEWVTQIRNKSNISIEKEFLKQS